MATKEKKRVLVSLAPEKAEILENMSKKEGISKSALITSWINEKAQTQA